MDELKLIVRTADRTKKAEVNLSADQTVSDITQAASDNGWLSKDVDYTVVNISTGRTLTPSHTLRQAGVSNGDTLEIQPVLVAGSHD